MINAERAGLAQFRIEGGGRLASRTLRVTLEPRSETGPMVNGNTESSGFRYQVHPDETYDVFIQNLPDDFYVASVRVNGGDVMAAGFEGWNSSLDKPFEVVLDSRGGRVGGRVIGPDGTVWSGANLMLIPDPAEGRLQAYRDGVADEYGIFQLRGVPPGKYVLVAWLDDPPCDFYDPSGLEACRAAGQAVSVDVASQQAFEFKVRLPSRR
jgi:hypothetical protein